LGEPIDGLVEIGIPQKFFILDFNDYIQAIINNIYPNLIENYSNDNYLQSRAILANRIEIVNEINEYVLSLTLGILLIVTS